MIFDDREDLLMIKLLIELAQSAKFKWNRVAQMTALGMVAYGIVGCASHEQIKKATGGRGGFSTVIVDAGHGGKDSGGTSRSRTPIFLKEKEMTLDTAQKVAAHLKQSGLNVVMTRNGDYFVDLDQRVAMANRYYPNAVLVSIHYNATGNRIESGAQTYFWHANSHGLAVRIQSHLVGGTQERDHGVTRRRLRLTRNPMIPCVLCECAYLTNPSEASLVAEGSYRSRIADSIASGIVEEYVKGDAGIASVAEIEAPMSRASDKYVRKRTQRVRRRSY
jgi:N-acetylmuramoyl-L-alanine amidase